jgi:hypothetical protein
MTRRLALRVAVLTLTSALTYVAPARADLCSDGESARPRRPLDAAPIRIASTDAADFGAAQEACGRTSIALESRASLLDASESFYGQLYANNSVRGTLVLPAGFWLSLTLPGVEARYVANATIDKTDVRWGAGALGAHVPLRVRDVSAFTAYGRVLLPTESAFREANRYGVEPGLSYARRLRPSWMLDANLAFPTLLIRQPGRLLGFIAPSLSADFSWRPTRGFGVSLGANLRAYDAFDLRGQLRFVPAGRFYAALGVAVPVHGRDRVDGIASVNLGWDGM